MNDYTYFRKSPTTIKIWCYYIVLVKTATALCQQADSARKLLQLQLR
jgi:hypothetical protein